MRFSMVRESLLSVLSRVVGVVGRKQEVPVLGHLLIRADNEGVGMIGTDLEIETVAKGKAHVDEGGEITVPAKKMLEICRALPEGVEVKIQVKGDKLELAVGKSRFKLITLPAEEFPEGMGDSELRSYEIPQSAMRWIIEKVAPAMAVQDVRYFLNGMLLEFTQGRLRGVATDGHRLALADVEASIEGDPVAVIIPRKAVLEINRMLEKDADPIKVAVGQSCLCLDRGDVRLRTKLLDGQFPNYESVIPKESGCFVELDRLEFLAALQGAAILAHQKTHGVRLMTGPDCLSVEGVNEKDEKAKDTLTAHHNFEHLEVGFNVNYLCDAVSGLDDERVRLDLKDGDSTMTLSGVGNDAVKQIVMPMRL